ncbi:hypothetical protein SAMN04490239_0005 [Rhodococcus koreensis]|uniref:Uncharacterized protein n=1 Tax=Rhodococcus koreensis TaxID=99653 RepID=A0A1H4I546_9NOCA|nr:hypothetical protein SAMN04490239_0005 [Rhodococcus koreensis]
MHDDDDHWERLIFGAEKFQRDLEVHALNLKFHHSESGHWQDKAHKILRWILLFAILTVSLMILTLLELFIGHQSNWWLVGEVTSAVSSPAFSHTCTAAASSDRGPRARDFGPSNHPRAFAL